MCGIAGIVWREKPYNSGIIESLQKALQHRGPDDQGVITLNSVSLVHTRLSIIDVAGGHQPLKDLNNNWLIGNGEIYNYVELKEQYSTFPYNCGSDMEVAFPLYQLYGDSYPHYLRGMFALAFYDQNADTLILSRDPYGIKPLYYVDTGDIFAFASEIQALLKIGILKAEINPSARDEVLQLRFNTGAETPYKGVKRLLPGETLVLKSGQIIKRFVHTFLNKKPKKVSYDHALKQFDLSLRDSVKVHLRSDVPYGLFLSGGIDSATLLKLMQDHTKMPLNTYTIGFDRQSVHDERSQAYQLAKTVGANHQEILFTEQDFWNLLPQVVKAIDDPIFDQAMLPTYKLAQVASKDIKVVLCGEGGDEMLAGYRRYQKASLPWWLGGRVVRKKGVFHKLDSLFKHDISQWRGGLETLYKQQLSSDWTRTQLSQAIDCQSWLPNNLLIKLDRCLMAHGVEGRTPLLDTLVTENSFALPDKLKISRGYGKWLLRKWLEINFPEAKPFDKKRGFRVPVGDWMITHKHHLGSLMSKQEGLKEICNLDQIKYFFENLSPRQEFPAWALLVYTLWYKNFIQRLPLQGNTFDCLEKF
jgi:asparagine synthase (glutamine-hydrolysing)